MRTKHISAMERVVDYYALKYTRLYKLQPADMADLLQVGYVAALEAMPAYSKDKGSVGTYLSQRVSGAMLSHLSADARRGITGATLTDLSFQDFELSMDGDDTEDEDTSPEPSQNALDSLAAPEATDLSIEQATSVLEQLPPRQRELLAAYCGLGGRKPMTVRQLAAKRRVSVAVMHERIILAMCAAEKLLKDNGVDADAV